MCNRAGIEDVFQNWDQAYALELGFNMCTKTGIKHMHWNWDEACAPELGLSMCMGLSPGNLAERSEFHGIDAS